MIELISDQNGNNPSSKMPQEAVPCPFPGCVFITPAGSDELVTQLLKIHFAGAHTPEPSSSSAADANAASSASIARIQKVSRPTVSLAGTSEEWSYFLTRWGDYKDATRVTGKEKIIQLLECCDEDLRKDLTRNAGGTLSNQTETQVLAAMELLAVRQENTMVARVALYEMRQDPEEGIRSYGARIRGQANVCKFLLACPHCNEEVNYTGEILRDVLTRGITDNEIQLDLLGDSNQDMTLEETFKFIEAKEAGKRSASRLMQIQSINSTRSSQYKQNKQDSRIQRSNRHADNRTNDRDTRDNNPNCNYCGNQGHGKTSPGMTRKTSCPAYGKVCTSCQKFHHFASVCRNKNKHNTNNSISTEASKPDDQVLHALGVDDTSFRFQLCAISNNTTNRSITIDHHLYNHLEERWSRQPSKPQPFLTLTIGICREDYSQFGLEPPQSTKTAEVSAMADTGCQSCLAGMNVIQRLGVQESDLILVRTQMHAANNNKITILGAVLLEFSGTASNGDRLFTRQITYVTNSSDKIFLSREGCAKLGMISESFPTIGDVLTSQQQSNAVTTTNNNADAQDTLGPTESVTCTPACRPRKPPPPKPSKCPFPADEEHLQQIEQFLIHTYRDSTFNTCPHQPLPSMTGPPLRLHIDPEASPVARHKPIPVPIHIQDPVKKTLDENVTMEVLEKVPPGIKTTWCAQMVPSLKKNGKVRLTIDYQGLNKCAKRETHHTPSPFHQACAVPPNMRKTTFDAWNGYHSLALHPDDKHYTTFITPWGRYRYKKAPQGYTATGDAYTSRFDAIVSHITNKTKIIDDSLHWVPTILESFFQAVEWLDTCGHNGVILNAHKFNFGRREVDFAGFEITMNSIRPTAEFFTSIQNFPTPKTIVDLRAWCGLINHAAYAFASAPHMQPFRELLKPKTTFTWTTTLDELFESSKQAIIKEIEEGVRIFEKNRPTCLATDWSKSGIGFWLTQKHCSCSSATPFCCKSGWKVTLIGSRFTRGAESRYAPIKGEALAVVSALDKTRYFVIGCNDLTIAVDHKPLLKIFSDCNLNDVPNPRLRNLKEKTL